MGDSGKVFLKCLLDLAPVSFIPTPLPAIHLLLALGYDVIDHMYLWPILRERASGLRAAICSDAS